MDNEDLLREAWENIVWNTQCQVGCELQTIFEEENG